MKKYVSLTHAVLASTLFVGVTAYADTTINTPMVNQNTLTSVDGNITVATTGQLLMNANAPNGGAAILVNSTNATINLNSNNTVPAGTCVLGTALCTTGAGGPGINISAASGGVSAIINVGAGTGISAVKEGILVDGVTSSINNSGTITGANGGGNFSAINLTTNSLNTSVYNNAGGTLTSATTALAGVPTVYVNGQGAFIQNTGTISAANGNDAILVNQNFGGVVNVTGGTINVVNGDAIHVTGAPPVTGNISNSGTINVIGTGNGVHIQNDYNGNIANNAPGTINVTGAGVGINIGANFNAFTNSGTITAAAGARPMRVTADTTGTITNTGTMTSVNLRVIRLEGDVASINNSGTMQVAGNVSPAIGAEAGVDVVGGITNTGTIGTPGFALPAINLAAGNNIVLTQAGGTINGNVLLAQAAPTPTASVFNMTGGTIDGNVTAASVNPNFLTLSGGTITGTLQLGNLGDVVTLSGTDVDTINGGALIDIVDFSGGGFNTLNLGANDFLNILGSVTVPVTTNIIVGTINVNSPATVTNNGATVAANDLNIAAGAAVINNAPITFTNSITNNGTLTANDDVTTTTLNNNGTLSITSPAIVTANGAVTNSGSVVVGAGATLQANTTYTQNTGASYTPIVSTAGPSGLINVTGVATLQAGSIISPQLSSTNGYIPNGSVFNVITAGGIVDNGYVLTPPSSATLFFTGNIVGGNTLVLTASHNLYSSIVTTQPGVGVAQELDFLARGAGPTDPTLQLLLGQLDTLPTAQALQDAIESLTPTINYALVEGSYISVDSAFNSILYRIENMRNLKPLGTERYAKDDWPPRSGQNYGDCNIDYIQANNDCRPGVTGVWFKVYGTLLDQKTYKNVSGYLGDSVGYAIGADWGDPSLAAFGGAISYTNTHTVGRSEQSNIIDIHSVQGTVYGLFEPIDSVFLDAMFGFAVHQYDSRRNIGIGTLTGSAFATFYGIQYAFQSDIGYAYTYDNIIVAPMGRFKYSYLAPGSYTEDGSALGVNLSVENKSLHEMIGGVGLKILGNKPYVQARYVPEASFMILYDFSGEGQETSSNFIGGGGLFPTEGPRPSHSIYQFGAGITAYTYDRYCFEFKYDLEIRDRYHFYANSAYMQLRKEWG